MHLFAVAWGLAPPEVAGLCAELTRSAGHYPHLDLATLWIRQPHNGVVAAGVTSRPVTVSPREYLFESGEEVVLFDGLPLEVTGSFVAHRASSLAARWDTLHERLEGRFVAVRLRSHETTVEFMNDPLGVAQVYYWEEGGRSVISNSAGVIQRFLGDRGHDPLGVSMFLAMDWVGSDRTLRDGVRVVPAGQHWGWRFGDRSWHRRTYWSIATHGPRPTRRVDAAIVEQTIEGLASVTTAGASVTGGVNAPLTGGKDSRMLASVLMRSGTPTRFWTKGDANSVDVGIASEIADRYGLPHRIANRPTQPATGRDPTRDVAREWRGISREFVIQTDGLASLFLVGNIQGQPSTMQRLEVTLSAMCAESARAVEAHEYLCSPGATVQRVARYLPYADTQIPRGLVRGEAYSAARQAVRAWVEHAADQGVPVQNLAVAFYLDERCRRWAANNPRELAQTEDKVLPFMTRPYVCTVLGLHPEERANHRLHRGVIRHLYPELEHTPALDIPWRVSSGEPKRSRAMINATLASLPHRLRRIVTIARDRVRPPVVARAPWSPYDEASWLEANLDEARETMLARPSSPLWSYLHRPTLEHLLDARTDKAVRRLHQLPLFAAYTMFMFEEIEAELANQPVGALPEAMQAASLAEPSDARPVT